MAHKWRFFTDLDFASYFVGKTMLAFAQIGATKLLIRLVSAEGIEPSTY